MSDKKTPAPPPRPPAPPPPSTKTYDSVRESLNTNITLNNLPPPPPPPPKAGS